MEEELTIEQMLKRSADARKVAKELERWLRNTQDLEKRKNLARLINICYTQAKKWRNEAKRCRKMAECIVFLIMLIFVPSHAPRAEQSGFYFP